MKLSDLESPYQEVIAISRVLGYLGIPAENITTALHEDHRSVGLQITSLDGKHTIALYAGTLKKWVSAKRIEAEMKRAIAMWLRASDDEKEDLFLKSECSANMIEIIRLLKEHNIIDVQCVQTRCHYCSGIVDLNLHDLRLRHQDPPCDVFVRVQQEQLSSSPASSLPN
jgi:hypothetical protein